MISGYPYFWKHSSIPGYQCCCHKIPMTHDTFLKNFLPFQEGQKISKRYRLQLFHHISALEVNYLGLIFLWVCWATSGEVVQFPDPTPKFPRSKKPNQNPIEIAEHRSRPPADQRTAEVRVQCRQCPEAARD